MMPLAIVSVLPELGHTGSKVKTKVEAQCCKTAPKFDLPVPRVSDVVSGGQGTNKRFVNLHLRKHDVRSTPAKASSFS